MKKTYYAIAKKNYGDGDSYDFVEEFPEDYENDEIYYNKLWHASFYDTEEYAENSLHRQPEWVQDEHVVVEYTRDKFNTYELK